MSTQITDVLNKQVANWNVLFVKLHNYHWYVQGPHFFTLHDKFEAFYNEAAIHIDELAERMLALGVKPLAKMSDYLQHASVQEAAGNENAEQMVETIIADFSIIIAESKEGMALAQEANDETTGDMLLAIYSELEKHVWMLKAFNA